jgi:hypothetical protein
MGYRDSNSFRSRLIAAVPMAILLLIGCGNPFSEFYSGKTVKDIVSPEVNLEAPNPKPQVFTTNDLGTTLRQWIEDGWWLLGQSSWTGGDVGSDSQAQEQARRIGASVVIRTFRYLGSSSGALPMTTPTVSTTYGSGTAYGTGGTATWNGTATTYGTQTTYVPVTVHRYQSDAAFLCRPKKLPTLGLIVRRMKPEEQTLAGTPEGAVVELVLRNTPAATSGLLPGDVVVRIGSFAVTNEQLYEAAVRANEGAMVEVEWIRGGQRNRREVQLWHNGYYR